MQNQPESSCRSGRLRFRGRSQRHGGLRGEQQEREGLLKIQPHSGIGVAQVANRDVLPDVQIEVAATRGQYKSPVYCGGPMILSSTRRLTCSSTG